MTSEVPPYRFERTHSVAEVIALADAAGGIEPGAGSGEVVSIAGRVMLSRPQGKIGFAELRDWTGSVQLFSGAAWTERFDELVALALGDWIGATGEVVRTKRGELSVKVESWVLLARARESFGEKWHGIADPDLRYRHREVDLWANEGVRDAFLLRTRLLSFIRQTLDSKGFVEVETPVLHPIPGGATAKPFVTHWNSLHADFYLRIATELYLKRLVVGGFERVYEIGRTFRNEGLSPRHNPEFTMLEAYQAYADYGDMMDLFEELEAGAALELKGTTKLTYQGRPLDFSPPWRRATMVDLIKEYAGVDVSLEMGADALRETAEKVGVEVDRSAGPGKIIFEIYEKTVEPNVWDPVFVCDYPQEVSPLARPHRSKPGWVERFEPVAVGRELGNAFSELCDPDEQRRMFVAQAAQKAAGDEEAMVVDEDYLSALMHGLPPTGGLGLGVDRLAMILNDVSHIREVLLFPALRPRPHRSSGEAGS